MSLPVSLTSIPLWTPSVESIAIVRTTSSPSWSATSNVNWSAPSSLGTSMCNALFISGTSLCSKRTSITGPITWVTRPIPMLISSFYYYSRADDPPTISVICWVIAACLALLYSNDKSSISSVALSEAFLIAVIREACSLAFASKIVP